MTKSNRTIIALITGHVALLVVFALFRSVDADEGFYLSAARQVACGKLPYLDFFFPQMPFLPALQSVITGHGFASLFLGRLLGLIPAILSLLLFVRVAAELVSSRAALTISLGLYALSGLLVAWHATAKTYAWTDLFLLVTFWSLLSFRSTRRSSWLVMSAVALALAVNFRLVLLAAAIPWGYFVRRSRSAVRMGALVASLGAALAVSIPSLSLFLLSPDRFLFDNFGFHRMRDPSLTFWGAICQRAVVVSKLAINPQLLMVAGLVLLAIVGLRKRGPLRANLDDYMASPSGLAAVFGTVIFLVYVLPAPIHQQYFVQTVAFGILAASPAIARIASGERVIARWRNETIIRWSTVLYSLTLVVYLVVYLGTVRAENESYAVPLVRDMCRFIEHHPAKGPVLSEWAGIADWSGRNSVPGLEFVGFDYPLPLSDTLKRYYHLPVNDDLRSVLAERRAALYVVWNAPDTPLQAVTDSNYAIAERFGKFVVYASKTQ